MYVLKYSEFAAIRISANKHNDPVIPSELSITVRPFQVGLTPTYLGDISVPGERNKRKSGRI